jgi:hypothetical protein
MPDNKKKRIDKGVVPQKPSQKPIKLEKGFVPHRSPKKPPTTTKTPHSKK